MFGDNYRFSVNDGNDYVCYYEMTKEPGECVCPQDTAGDGQNLMNYVLAGMSCAEAQAKYCSSGSGCVGASCGEPCGENCFCVYDNKVVDISGCVKTGKGVAYCRGLLCNGGPYKCKNSAGDRKGMDITGCVGTKMAQGASLNQALDYCDNAV